MKPTQHEIDEIAAHVRALFERVWKNSEYENLRNEPRERALERFAWNIFPSSIPKENLEGFLAGDHTLWHDQASFNYFQVKVFPREILTCLKGLSTIRWNEGRQIKLEFDTLIDKWLGSKMTPSAFARRIDVPEAEWMVLEEILPDQFHSQKFRNRLQLGLYSLDHPEALWTRWDTGEVLGPPAGWDPTAPTEWHMVIPEGRKLSEFAKGNVMAALYLVDGNITVAWLGTTPATEAHGLEEISELLKRIPEPAAAQP